jgi:hypothetical protein
VVARLAILGPRMEAPLRDLVHPVFDSGGVFAWEVSVSPRSASASATELPVVDGFSAGWSMIVRASGSLLNPGSQHGQRHIAKIAHHS